LSADPDPDATVRAARVTLDALRTTIDRHVASLVEQVTDSAGVAGALRDDINVILDAAIETGEAIDRVGQLNPGFDDDVLGGARLFATRDRLTDLALSLRRKLRKFDGRLRGMAILEEP